MHVRTRNHFDPNSSDMTYIVRVWGVRVCTMCTFTTPDACFALCAACCYASHAVCYPLRDLAMHHMLLAIRYVVLPIHYMLLAIRYVLIPIHYMLLAIRHVLIPIHYMLLAIRYVLLAMHHMLLAMQNILLNICITCCLLSVIC